MIWFRCETERANSGRGQQLRFFVDPQGTVSPAFYDVTLLETNRAGEPTVWGTASGGPGTVELGLPDFEGDRRLFMVVEPSFRS